MPCRTPWDIAQEERAKTWSYLSYILSYRGDRCGPSRQLHDLTRPTSPTSGSKRSIRRQRETDEIR